MNFVVMVATAIVGWVGQWFKSKPQLPTVLPLLAMSALGLLFYGVSHGWPTGNREAILAWLDNGWVWALALPGAASYFGLAKGMETKQ